MNSVFGGFPRGLGDIFLWLVPIGAGFEWWGTEADKPRGYLMQDGTVYSISQYPKLAKRLGNRYGGDGITTFAVPDRRGRVAIGKDDMGGAAANRVTVGGAGFAANALGATGGAETVTLGTPAIPSHTHDAGLNNTVIMNPSVTTDVMRAGGSWPTTATGGGGSHNNVQPTIVTNFIIRAG